MKNRRKFLIGFVGCCFLLLYQGCLDGYDILDECIEEKPLVTSLAQEELEYGTPTADLIYDSNGSSLTRKQKRRLDKALKAFIKKHPVYARMFNELCEKGGLMFEINYNLLIEKEAKAGYLNRKIMFLDQESITEDKLEEEMIHAIQDLYIYGKYYMDQARKNVEFEAKVLRDIITANTGGGGFYGSAGENNIYMNSYASLVWEFCELSFNEFTEKFHDLCTLWHGYKGSYQVVFRPEMIVKYRNIICQI